MRCEMSHATTESGSETSNPISHCVVTKVIIIVIVDVAAMIVIVTGRIIVLVVKIRCSCTR